MAYAPYDGGWQDLPDTSTPITAAALNSISYGYRYVQTVFFTSSGSFVKADYPWLRGIRVRLVGGGGGGGGAEVTGATTASSGAGGGGGGYAEKWITDISSLDASITVTRGTAGTAGTDAVAAGDGGTSSFGALLEASGGVGGTRLAASSTAASAHGGQGGSTFSGADFSIRGQAGHISVRATAGGFAGGGGNSHLGSGGRGAQLNTAGTGGHAYGGGGGGACNQINQSARNGGAGAIGIVIVDLFA